jgi:transposase
MTIDILQHILRLKGQRVNEIELEYIGVDEVARAKGHDYMTVVYDMVGGHLIWVEAGRTAEVFLRFLKQLRPDTAHKI